MKTPNQETMRHSAEVLHKHAIKECLSLSDEVQDALSEAIGALQALANYFDRMEKTNSKLEKKVKSLETKRKTSH